MREYVIKNAKPAKDLLESMVVGNGRLGAVLNAGKSEEILTLNEEAIWSSRPTPEPNPEMYDKLEILRNLFREGKNSEADQLSKTLLSDCFSRIRSYEAGGNLKISLHENDHCRNYKNELDIMRGVARVEYDRCGTHYVRECFSSYPDNVLVYHVTSDSDVLCAQIGYEHERLLSISSNGNELCAIAKTVYGDHKFCVKARVYSDGTVSEKNGELFVTDANEITVLVNITTEFFGGVNYKDSVSFPEFTGYKALYDRHTEDFLALMTKADIEIPFEEELENENVTVPTYRAAISCDKANEGGLVMRVWQYGRYLLASSSRPGTLPANLQGLWVDSDVAPWNSDYHTNINLQMNYWPAEVANLSETHLPLFDYIKNFLLESGKKTAKVSYRARGSVVHHLSDIYGFTTPADGIWGMWSHGLSWLCFHVWEHYLFTKDEEFLKNIGYEIIRESSLFFLDTMFEDKQGRLVFAPSTSPENRHWFVDENGNKSFCFLTMSSTMDTSIIGGLLRMYIKSSEILGVSDEDTKAAAEALEKMPKLFVGKHGQLAEWLEDYEEVEVGHRHFSPTFGFYPDNAITRKTPELYEAVKVTLARRFGNPGSNNNGANAVAWSVTWLMCDYARLHMGENAYMMIINYINTFLTSNLMSITTTTIMPVFQIEACMGFTAGIAEMLLQSHEDMISLLPALPSKWEKGSFRGLCARGGYEVDVKWEEHSVEEFEIRAKFNGEVVIELPESQKNFTFVDANGNVYTANNRLLALNVDGKVHLKVK